MDSFAKLEIIQTSILQRITDLEAALSRQNLSTPPALLNDANHDSAADTVSRLSAILTAGGVRDYSFKRVPPDYYDRPLDARREILNAATVDHLCKSIVLVNTQAPASIVDCSDPNNSKYYIVIIQYTARLNAENVKNFLYSLNDGKISKKKFNLRLAPEEESVNLTGFEHNAVTCIGMKTNIPVILDEAIDRLEPNFFWLGGGETDLKLGIRTPQFIDFVKPFIVNCSN